MLQVFDAGALPLDTAGFERAVAGARTARLLPEGDCTPLVQLRAALVALRHLPVRNIFINGVIRNSNE